MSRFDNTNKRKLGSYNIMKMVKEYNDETSNLTNQASMLVCNYADPETGEDAQNRAKLLNCCMQISGAADELTIIDKRYSLDLDGPAMWVYITTNNVLRYIPPLINEIKTQDGRKIDKYQKDIEPVFKIINSYKSNEIRSNWLRSGFSGFYYDDDFMMPRTIRTEIPIYDRVISDVSVGKDFWGNISTNKSYKSIITDRKYKERESIPEPELPTASEMSNLLKFDPNKNDGILGLINTMKGLKAKHSNPMEDEEYYPLMELSLNELKWNLKDLNISNEAKTKEFAEMVYETLPDELYYEFEDKTFCMFNVIEKEIRKIEPSLKFKYIAEEDKCKELVRYYIYNNHEIEDYYNDFKYEVYVRIEKSVTNVTDKSLRAHPTNSINDEALMNTMEEFRGLLRSKIYGAKEAVESTPEEARCLEFSPVASYEIFYNFIRTFRPVNVQQCERLVQWCTNTLEPWCNKRRLALKGTITDIDNISILLGLHQKRLTKATGSFLIWYQSIIQMDNSYKNYLNTKKITENLCKNMLVANACDNPDQRMFYHFDGPDYIDLNPIDPLFGSSSFNTGDTIYIINDLYEQTNYITRIETVDVASTDIADIDMEALNNGNLMNGVTSKTIPITRLVLKYPLPYWCNTEDLEDLRIVKIL